MGCLCTTLKWVIGLGILAGIVWFFVWLFQGPHWHIKVNVESATLTRFDLDGNNTLHYNLTLSVSVRNANKGGTIYYNNIAASALYDGKLFGATDVPAFTQGRKTTTVIYPAFQGQTSVPRDSFLAVFNREKGQGIYSIDVKFNTNIEIVWTSSSDSGTYTNKKGYALQASCTLRVPRVDGAANGAVFNTTICDVKF